MHFLVHDIGRNGRGKRLKSLEITDQNFKVKQKQMISWIQVDNSNLVTVAEPVLIAISFYVTSRYT